MILALLAGRCEEELICDMAEVYRIYNWRELPLQTAAILASGLPQDSRSKRKLSGQKLRSQEYVELAILDELRQLNWAYVSAHNDQKIPKPQSLLTKMLQQDESPKTLSFRTPEEFEARMQQIIKGE